MVFVSCFPSCTSAFSMLLSKISGYGCVIHVQGQCTAPDFWLSDKVICSPPDSGKVHVEIMRSKKLTVDMWDIFHYNEERKRRFEKI